jgi:hypothetical protein
VIRAVYKIRSPENFRKNIGNMIVYLAVAITLQIRLFPNMLVSLKKCRIILKKELKSEQSCLQRVNTGSVCYYCHDIVRLVPEH